MFEPRFGTGILKRVSQSLTALLVASALVILPPAPTPAEAVLADGSDSEVDYAVSLDGLRVQNSSFSLNNQYLKTAASIGNRGSNSSMMIEAWVKPKSVTDQNVVFAKQYSFLLRASNNGWILNSGNGSSWPAEVRGPAVVLDAWTHVAVVVTSTDHKLYVNGALVATAASGGHVDTNDVVSVGAYSDGNVPFHGEIDEVRIWTNKDGSHIPTTMHSRASANDSNLQAYWDFNETSGATVYNRKSGGANLIHQGTALRTDVKNVSATADGDTIVSFPRTYLPGIGGWRAPSSLTSARALIVGGGGGGGAWIGGGGGAGGFRDVSSPDIDPGSIVPVTVGQGGIGAYFDAVDSYPAWDNSANWTYRNPTSGQSSSLGNLASPGGGHGANFLRSLTLAAASGGSGGGGTVLLSSDGVTTNQALGATAGNYGTKGGDGAGAGAAAGITIQPHLPTGGGGGAGGPGYRPLDSSWPGDGGAGLASSIIPTSFATQFGIGQVSSGQVYFSGGGAGSLHGDQSTFNSLPTGLGGLGGGGNGTAISGTYPAQIVAQNGQANTGGGGGGAANFISNISVGGSGGSGVVILRYESDFDLAWSKSPTSGNYASSNTQIVPSSGDWSFEAWIWPNSEVLSGSGLYGIFTQQSDSDNEQNRAGLWVTAGSIGYNYGGTTFTRSEVVLDSSRWYHVALTQTANSQKLYVDGHLFQSTTFTRETVGANFTLGGLRQSNFLEWSGQLDQVKVWVGELTPEQVQISMHTYSSSGITGKTLRAHYDFNEFQFGSLLDRSGNNFHLPFNLSAAGNYESSDLTSLRIVEEGNPTATTRTVKFNRSYLTAVGGWTPVAGISRYQALVVGGGGGGGSRHGGGGGAGALLWSDSAIVSNVTRIQVGQGGPGVRIITSHNGDLAGKNGQSSWLGASELKGGGGGGGGGGAGGLPQPGGSAGGGQGSSNFASAGTGLGLKNDGGYGAYNSNIAWMGGGGGGAMSSGASATSSNLTAGIGGSGYVSNITGTAFCYAAGGGGGASNGGTPAEGGICNSGQISQVVTSTGGQGTNVGYDGVIASSGVANSGSGGGGGGYSGVSSTAGRSGNGGSGAVILSYSLAPDAPTLLTATQSTSHATVNLSWTAPSYTGNSAISDYAIEYRPLGGSWTSYSDAVSTLTTATVTLGQQCVEHEFRVIAKNGAYSSQHSSTVSATPVWGSFGSLAGVVVAVSNSACVVKFISTGSHTWTPPVGTDAVLALVVGGGGGGGSAGDSVPAGGGGAGGFVETQVSNLTSTPIPIFVGAGGVGGGATYWSSGSNGQTSTFSNISALGGGGGGGRSSAGLSGGSGGGAGGRFVSSGGSGLPGQGFSGGSVTAQYSGGGGGGGARSAGAAGGISAGGAGGVGSYSYVVGSVLATGGSGGSENSAIDGASATANSGNGGGGGGTKGPQSSNVWSMGGAGGSGVVAIRQISATTPVVSSQPSSASVQPGISHILSISAAGNGLLSYQWQSSTDGANWTNVGTNAPSFTTPAMGLADNGIQYRVVVTNTLNGQTSQVTSNVATISVTGVTIAAGACSAMVGEPAGVTISETANGACLVEYKSPGNNSFYVPNLVSSIQAFIVGGGGGGGGANRTQGGGGGGGGAASRLLTLPVTASQMIPLSVGAGGAGGAALSNGSDGGATSISTSYSVPGGRGGKAPTNWPGGAGEGGSGPSGDLYATSGASGGNGVRDPGDRSYYQPKFGNAGSSRTFAGKFWCVGGGGGGGNREVANDPYFHWEPRSQFCSDGVTKSGGSGGWHNGTTNVLPTAGLTNSGGGGGGGSYNNTTNRAGGNGADGIVAIYFVPGTGNISLSSIAAVSYSGTTHAVTLTKDNPTTTVSWTTSNAAVCTVTGTHTGGTVTEVAAGLCEVSVVVAASSPYARGTSAVTFRIDKITRTAPTWTNNSASVPFGGTIDLRLKLSSPGSNAYTFTTSGTAGSCSVTGYTLNVGSVGDTCSVTPTLVGDSIYADVQGTQALSVTVTRISQSALVITSGTLTNVNQVLNVSAAGGSGTGALSYHVANQGTTGCTIDSSTGALTAATAGNCEVYAQRAQSTNYDAITSSHMVVAVSRISQNLTWVSQPQARYLPGNTYALEATASSQLAVAYSISAGLCTLSGSTVTFTGSGDCVIHAGQPGDGSYFAAVTISQTVSVGKINQTMTFSALANRSWGSLAFSLSATASSGLAIAYSENNQTTNDACDVSSNGIVTIKNVGSCAITALQSGDASYTSVTATRIFEVTANQAGAPFIGSVSFGDRQLNASFFTPSYLGGGTISAYELRAYKLDGTLASTNTGCVPNAGATQSCSVIGLDNGTKYVLRVAAITQAGLGQLSASSSEIIPASNPEAVGNLIAIEGNGSLSLQWTPPTSFGGGTFFQYRIYWRAPGQQYQPDGSPGATVGNQASRSYVITGLVNGVSYDVKIVTATSNNNIELQSNTAEVRQTPYTVPDAPAAVVALDNVNTFKVAWQPPTFDGGNAIDQYVVQKDGVTVCTINTASSTSCEVPKPAPGTTAVIGVRAGNDAGLSAPASTSITVQALPSSVPSIGGGSGSSAGSVLINTPTVTSVSGSSKVQPGELVRILGTGLSKVQRVTIGGIETGFILSNAGTLQIRIPEGLALGRVAVTFYGDFGVAIFSDLLEIVKTETVVQPKSKVSIGSYLGKVAIYTLNHQGKRLSIRIGNKWQVIDPLTSNFTETLTASVRGGTVTVKVYLDRKLVETRQTRVR